MKLDLMMRELLSTLKALKAFFASTFQWQSLKGTESRQPGKNQHMQPTFIGFDRSH